MSPSHLKWIQPLAALVFLAGCQKARMTTVEPQPTPVPVATQVQPPAPTPIPPTPAIPLPDSHRHKKKHHHRPIIIGEDPRPPEFHPTPGEPMDPGGEFDTDIFRQNSQTGTETSTKGGKNKVDWFEQDQLSEE